MVDDTTVTNRKSTFDANTNDDYIVETEDQGAGVQRQVVKVAEGTVTSTPSGTQNIDIVANTLGIDFATQTTLAAILAGQLADGHNVTVDNATLAVTQSGTWNITNVSGTISLPTGASTAANQSTIIGHVDGIEGLLTTIDTDTGSMATDLTTLAGTVSGTELQVDILTLPSGSGAGGFPNATTVNDTTQTKQTLVAVGTSSTVVIAADATRTGFLVRSRTSANVYFCMQPATIADTNDYRMTFQNEGIGCNGPDAQDEYRAITDAASSKNVEVIEWFED